MRESSLWKWLQQAEKKLDFTTDLHWRRVENLVAEGDPDVEGCYKGRAFNIELKVADRPARPTTRVLGPSDIRPRQIPWAKARWAAGGRSYFLIQVGSSATARRYLIAGKLGSGIIGADEEWLRKNSIVMPDADQVRIIENACEYRSIELESHERRFDPS